MADFDLSLVATFDTQQAETGAQKVEGAIDKVATAEKRANETTRQSKTVLDSAAKAERERAAAIDAVRSAIEPQYAAQQRMNGILAQAKTLYQQNAISLKQLEAVEKLHAQAMKGGAASAGQARSAYTNLGFQIQDITQTLALGINPMVVFGQQAGQTAAAVSGMGGALGRVGTFLSGPWGSLILGAVTVGGLLISSLLKTEDAAEKAGDALDFQKQSTAELTKAIRENLAEARKSVELGYQQAEAARATAQQNLNAAISVRERTKALIELYNAEARRGPTGLGGQGQQAAAIVANKFTGDLGAQDANIKRLEETLRLRDIPIRRREAEAANDAAAAATLRYEKAEADLNEQYRKGKLSADAYGAALSDLYGKRDRALDQLRKTERATKEATKAEQQFGREINSTAAKSIAAAAGFRVTSADRTRAQQQRLYDTVRTKENPVALPGTSAHEKGNALDIAFGKGVTPAAIKEAFRKEGVTLTKILKETGHYHIEWSTTGADKVEREAERIADFGEKAAEKIRRLSERFDEQPRLIDTAAQAARELDVVIAELSERKPAGFEALIEEAREAKGVIADSLLRPFEDLIEASERRLQIGRLLSQGRDAEAEALQTIWQLEERLGPLSRERKEQILDTVRAEREITEELRNRQELQDAYLDATRSVRQEVEAILSGTGKLSNLKNVFSQLKGRVLAEQIFGGVFRDLEKYVKQETGIRDSVDILSGETERAGAAAGEFADTLDDVVRQIRTGSLGSGDGAPAGDFETFLAEFDKTFGKPAEDGPTSADDAEIVVTAIKGGVNGLTPERYFEEMTKRVVKPLLDGLDGIFGTEFFGKLNGAFAGGVNGYLTGGVPGGILGALKGIKGLPEGISSALGKGLEGAQTGTAVAGIGKALGIKTSTTGAQLGGAIGSVIPIPGGAIIGSIAGGLLGGLFKKAPKASASFTGVDAFSTTSRGKGTAESIGGLAGAFQSSLQSIAQALDAELGAFSVSIGQRKDEFRVSSSSGVDAGAKKVSGLVYKGNDADAAVSAAIRDAIADGAVKGLSEAVRRALASSTDIDKAVAEAVKVKNLEAQLASLGDEFKAAFDEFRDLAAERVDLARKYGLDLLKVEELNAKERKQLLDDALERSVGSLRRLVDDLNFGNLFEGTASERREKLLGEVADARQDVSVGVAGAVDRLAELERQLIETSRAAFGTAGGEYAADRDSALSTAQSIIAAEQKRLEDAAASTQQQITLANETNDLLSGVNGRLDTLIGKFTGGGLSPEPFNPYGGLGSFSGLRSNVVEF